MQPEFSEASFRTFVENISDVIALLDPNGAVRYVSPSIKAALGYEPDEWLGRPGFDQIHPEDLERVRRFMLEGILAGRTAGRIAYRHRHKNGSWRHLESAGVNLLADPDVSAILVVSRDITERVEMEGRYQALFEEMIEGFARGRVLYGADGPVDWLYLEANRAFERQTGLGNVVGRKVSEVIPGLLETDRTMLDTYARVARSGGHEDFEIYLPQLGRWFAVAAYGEPPDGFVTILEDISQRKETETRLRRSEEQYRDLVNRAPLGIYRESLEGRFVSVNQSLVALLGYASAEDLLGASLADDVYVDAARRLEMLQRAAVEDGRTIVFETRWKRKDQRHIEVCLHVRSVRGRADEIEFFDGMVEDVTEQRNLEREFQQAQKMEAIGRLAGGVAHDFNNLLTAIIGFGELLSEELPKGDPRHGEVVEILNAARRASGLTRQLLAFSRKAIVQPRVLDLNYVLRAMERLLRRLLPETIGLDLVLSDAPVVVNADPTQLEQVVMNLAVNARDAMPNGGRIRIRTAHVDARGGGTPAELGGVPAVVMEVGDTGIGMSADVQAHLFEPFFTTKAQGQGTGLGLSTVYGIVKQNGGAIAVDSAPGLGTTLRIFLPAAQAVEGSRADGTEAVRGGRETILVAEDDPAVRTIVSRVLSQKGYHVIATADAAAAREAARGHGAGLALLITDLVMPGEGGRELAEALTADRPGLRVLFISGYTDDVVFQQGILERGARYLQKPFAASALARAVRQALDDPAG